MVKNEQNENKSYKLIQDVSTGWNSTLNNYFYIAIKTVQWS